MMLYFLENVVVVLVWLCVLMLMNDMLLLLYFCYMVLRLVVLRWYGV